MSSNTISLTPIFAPTQISGCQLWLDGADSSSVTLVGSGVSQWNDKSGNNRHATQGTAGNRPAYTRNALNGLGSLTFTNPTSSANYLTLPSFVLSANNQISVFVVINCTTSNILNGGDFFLVPADYSIFTMTMFNNNYTVYIYNLSALSTGFAPRNLTSIIGATYNGTTTTPYANGTAYSTRNDSGTALTNSNILWLGGAQWNWVISEVLWYNTSLSTTQRQQVEGYLAWKWGLVGNLPANHPYKTTQLYANTTLPPQFRTIGVIPMAPSSLPFSFFRPTQVPGCQVWIDAFDPSTVSQSGGTVSTVADKSGNGYNLTGGAGFTYPNNTFNGTSYPSFFCAGATAGFRVGRNTSLSLAQPVSHFIVAQRAPGLSAFPYLFDGVSSRNYAYYSSGSQIAFGAGLPLIYNAPSSGYIFNGIANGASSQIYGNGTSIGTGDIGASAFGGITLGNAFTSASDAVFNGHICEYMCFNRVLGTSQRQQIEGYLAWKWGLQTSLPSNHPFRNAPPGLPLVSVPPTRFLSSGGFRPVGAVLWLDGTDPAGNGVVPANGASVTTWVDKSGSGNNATGGTAVTLNSTGINNLPVTSYNATPSYFNSTDLYSNRSFSVFIVARRQAANSTAQGLIGGTGSSTNQNMIILFAGATTLRFAFYGNDLDATIPAYTGNTATEPAYIYGFTYTPGTRIISVNGTVAARDTNASNLTSSVGMTIGWWGNGPAGTFAFNGFIGEILVYNTTPTQTSRQTVEGYLAWKWGLVGSLPATHPYKKYPPPPS